ncbi:MAG: 6,7-dimethyl-8-ribityllumazine synthase [Bacteroidetes bacterium]|jgi:6,7-dimethyl-8-ribityllumazine synthase|nr:MAG: 6,7-dimethyl-8-ribityllumazine synthase [Cryomorphaceae bacterium BACL29 MAG-121220-bin8]MDA0758213.1 6,7-dimethyl-8-ribityllumazine synthase [Bacteroidota bacterium]MDA1019394.1 6,7-dimethyl-8-ribityllumazine synthase [Bacteroidota bacterium]|tara:strand:+ start:10207 stop:10680 length:474 start_codon:yes stop_codon:yes gene_type:complete
MSSAFNNLNNIDLSKIPDATNLKFGIAVSNWNKEITDNLLSGCIDLLKSKGVLEDNIIISHVPGSFELIYASKKLQLQDVNSVIAIGSVIRGETMHFDFICNATSIGIKDLNISGKCPVIFCVLTDDNMQQSIDRSGGKYGNKGSEAAIAAIKMALI